MLGLIVKGLAPRTYLFVLRLNTRYFVCLVQFSSGRVVCLILIEHENVALAKKKCFWLQLILNAVGFRCGSDLLRKMLILNSPAVAAPGSNFPPDWSFVRRPIRLSRSLAPKVLIARRCGWEDKVSSRLEFHPTSDSLLFYPARVAQPLHHLPLRVVEQSSLQYPPLRRPVAFIARVVTYLVLMLLRRCGS